MRRSPFLFALLPVLFAAPASAGAPDVQQVMALGAACEDTARADSAFQALGQVIAATTDSFPIAYCHYLRFRAARTLGRLDAMQVSADSAVLFAPESPRPFVEAGPGAGWARDVRLDVAEDYARRAVEAAARATTPTFSGWSLAVLGTVQVARHYERARGGRAAAFPLVPPMPDSQGALLLLGKTCSRPWASAVPRSTPTSGASRSTAATPPGCAKPGPCWTRSTGPSTARWRVSPRS